MTAAMSPALTDEISSRWLACICSKPADALALALGRVQRVAAGFQRAGVDADVCQLADVRVGRDLEHQGRERLARLDRAYDLFARPWIDAGHRRHVERRRQVVDDGVEHRLDALVLQRAPVPESARADRSRSPLRSPARSSSGVNTSSSR